MTPRYKSKVERVFVAWYHSRFYSVRLLDWFTSCSLLCACGVVLTIAILFSFCDSAKFNIFLTCGDRDSRQNGRNGEDPIRSGQRERSYSGPLTSTADRSINGNQGGSRSANSGMHASEVIDVHSDYCSKCYRRMFDN